ncbi:MAG: hypothetical protein V7717_08940 [Porticoccaceae bacterium]
MSNFKSMRIITLLSTLALLSGCTPPATESSSDVVPADAALSDATSSTGDNTEINSSDTAYRAPRAADGIHPDLNGIWQALNEANYDLEIHMARPAMALRDGPAGPIAAKDVLKLGAVGAVPPSMGVVEGGKIPYTPEALAIKQENQRNWLDRDPEIKCYLPGIPRATYMPHPFQIFQGDDSIFFAYQYAGAARDIFTKDPGPAPVDSWMGQSVASWDGDTLVLDVTGIHPDTWLDRAGNHHSDQLHVVERFTPMGPNHLQYEATITDPLTYTKPWKISMPLYRRMETNMQLLDFKCVEFVEELLYGDLRAKPLD